MDMAKNKDIIVIGGGQSGLACGYYLKKENLDYLILDDRDEPGASWHDTWDSLRLFSPNDSSSIPGWMMPEQKGEVYPTRDHTIKYLQKYEQRYNLNIERPVKVLKVNFEDNKFIIETNNGTYKSSFLISATGTQSNPYIPDYEGIETFPGKSIHSSEYKSPEEFRGDRVMIVGGGNSAAQIIADLHGQCEILWVVEKEPKFLPENIDGRFLFNLATEIYKARERGEEPPKATLGDIVQVDSVKEASVKENYNFLKPFDKIEGDFIVWNNTKKERVDSIIWCTGFKPSISHLNKLNIFEKGRIPTKETQSKKNNKLFLVGYGNWTGFASATLVGVGRYAKRTVRKIKTIIEG